MVILWLSSVALVAVGGALLATGSTVIGAVLLVVALLEVVLARALGPAVRSSREIAEQNGMDVGRLTGAPKLGPAMRDASSRMEQAQAHMGGLAEMMGAGLRRHGIEGRAIVTSATDTGERQNLNPIYEVVLSVVPSGGASYDAIVKTEVNALAVAQCVAGTQVDVRIDPDDPHHLWVDWLAVAGRGG